MKPASLLALLAALHLLLPLPVGADTNRPGRDAFLRLAPVQAPAGGFTNGTLYRAPLPAVILSEVSPNLQDLRLFDAQGRETPFVVLENRIPGQPEAWRRAELTDYVPDSGDGEALLLFKLPEAGRRVTGLELDTPSRDFHKTTALESSPDGAHWTPVAAGEVYDFTSRVALRRTTLEFSAQDNTRFRLRLRNAAPHPDIFAAWRMHHGDLDIASLVLRPESLRITSASLRLAEVPEQVVWDRAEPEGLSISSDKGDTVVEIMAGLPAGRITPRIATAVFNRTVEVLGSQDAGRTKFSPIGRGIIHRMPGPDDPQGNATLAVGDTWRRGYRLRIRDQGAPPLEITGVRLEWPQRLLFFMPQADSPAMALHFTTRREQLPLPAFDLARMVTPANWPGLPSVQVVIGPAADNSDARSGWSLFSGTSLLTALVLVLCGVLAIWLTALVRRR